MTFLKYDSASGTFKVEADRIANHLTTKGDLLAFSTEETRMGIGTDTYILTADSSATHGFAWTAPAAAGDPAGTAVAMAIALG